MDAFSVEKTNAHVNNYSDVNSLAYHNELIKILALFSFHPVCLKVMVCSVAYGVMEYLYVIVSKYHRSKAMRHDCVQFPKVVMPVNFVL